MTARSEPYRPGAPIVAELAAGAVVVRDGRVLLLHELAEDRWCLPKGHVDEGESLEQTALREVREETGLQDVRLGVELGEVSYRFFAPGKGRNVHKSSVYFLAHSSRGEVRTEAIFDRWEWSPPAESVRRVRFPTDREILEKARRHLASLP